MKNIIRRTGFTLIELLVVVAIIGILMSLLLPSLMSGQQRAWQTGCQANLKNISTALRGWVEDHQGWLPPGNDGRNGTYGLWCNQIANYTSGDKYHLNYYLATYLGCPAPSSTNRIIPQFVCPTFQRYGKNYDMNGRVVYARTTGFNWGDSTFDPFGYPPSVGTEKGPQKLESVAAILPLASVWVLVDADQLAFGDTWGEPGGLPPQPSHGNQRNYLFFDGHVAVKNVPANGAL